MMNGTERIRAKIKALYETNPRIHVSLHIKKPKLDIENDPAVIKDVYTNVFRIEERSTGAPRCHTLQYTDILIGQISIAELTN